MPGAIYVLLESKRLISSTYLKTNAWFQERITNNMWLVLCTYYLKTKVWFQVRISKHEFDFKYAFNKHVAGASYVLVENKSLISTMYVKRTVWFHVRIKHTCGRCYVRISWKQQFDFTYLFKNSSLMSNTYFKRMWLVLFTYY